MKTLLVVLAVGLALIGCQSANRRIQEHAAEFSALDPATQADIRAGIVKPGYTSGMAYLALGRPAAQTPANNGDLVWSYEVSPVTAPNETIQNGFRKRTVYDPVKRSYDVLIEPIDPKAFPHLVPHTLRLTFHEDRLTTIERSDRP